MIRVYTYLSRVLAVLILAGCVNEINQTGPYDYDPVLLQLVAETNFYRRAAGLQTVQTRLSLMQTAQHHSQAMSDSLGLQHSNPYGHNGGWSAENIAWGQESAREVAWSWMHSYGHRRNLLNPAYRYIGVGKVGEYWVSQYN